MLTLKELQKHCSEEVRELNRDLFAASTPVETKRSKYGNTKVVFDGMTFDSAKECRRYQELAVLQVGDDIQTLRRQVTYILQAPIVDSDGNRQRAIKYTADFVYTRGEETFIEDVKSDITAKSESFRVRWRMLLAQFKNDPHTHCVIYNP